jgi:hypothetical protein
MQEGGIFELFYSKKEEILKVHNKLLSQMDIIIDDNQEDKNRIRIGIMLRMTAESTTLRMQGHPRTGRNDILIFPTWEMCKRNEINNHVCLDENFCGESTLDDFFECERSARNCFEFVLNALKDMIKGYEVILK